MSGGYMKLLTLMRHFRAAGVAVLALLTVNVSDGLADQRLPHCVQVGGAILTNLGVVDGNTTLGTATGDLKGAVSASILSVAPGKEGTTVFAVQHHLVTESGA